MPAEKLETKYLVLLGQDVATWDYRRCQNILQLPAKVGEIMKEMTPDERENVKSTLRVVDTPAQPQDQFTPQKVEGGWVIYEEKRLKVAGGSDRVWYEESFITNEEWAKKQPPTIGPGPDGRPQIIDPKASVAAGAMPMPGFGTGQAGVGGATLGGMSTDSRSDVLPRVGTPRTERVPQKKQTWLQKNLTPIAAALGLTALVGGGVIAAGAIQNSEDENPSGGGGIGLNPPLETATPTQDVSPTVTPEGPLVVIPNSPEPASPTPEKPKTPDPNSKPLMIPEGIVSSEAKIGAQENIGHSSGIVVIDDNSHFDFEKVKQSWLIDLMKNVSSGAAGYDSYAKFVEAVNNGEYVPQKFDVFWGQENVTPDFSKVLIVYENEKPSYGWSGYSNDPDSDMENTGGYYPMESQNPEAGWWIRVQFDISGTVILKIAYNADSYKMPGVVAEPIDLESSRIADRTERAIAAIIVVNENNGHIPPQLDKKAGIKGVEMLHGRKEAVRVTLN